MIYKSTYEIKSVTSINQKKSVIQTKAKDEELKIEAKEGEGRNFNIQLTA